MTDFDYGNMTRENLRRAVSMAAEAIRYANHLTLGTGTTALEYPSDVDAVLVDLETLAQRLPQLLDQLGAWMAAECAAGRVRVAISGAHSPSTEGVAVSALRIHLDKAGWGVEASRQALHDARQITAKLAGVPDEGERG